jgi:hypothetical protein
MPKRPVRSARRAGTSGSAAPVFIDGDMPTDYMVARVGQYALGAAYAIPTTGVDFFLLNPSAQRIPATSELRRNGLNRRRLALVMPPLLKHHTHGLRSYLG